MADSKAFGRMLQQLMIRKGITRGDLAKAIGASTHKISEWEVGSKMPNREYARRMVEKLELNNDESRNLLALLEDNVEETNFTSNVYRPTGIIINDPSTEKSTKLHGIEIHKLETQIQQMQQAVDEISSKLNTDPAAKTQDQVDLVNEVQKLKENLSQMRIPAQPLTAPVILPPPEDMEVRLVSSTSLERLEEYRSEESKWYSIMGILLGASLGIVINFVTGAKLTTEAWVLLITLIGFTLFTGYTARTYQQRGNKIKSQILMEKAMVASKSIMADGT